RGRGPSCRRGSLLVGRLGFLARRDLRRLRGRRGVFDERADRADFDGVADRDLLLAHHAGTRRGTLARDLAGLEAGDGLVALDLLAGLLEPFADRRFGHRFPECGDFHFTGHYNSSPTITGG